jgi:hypothetical protein
MKLGIFRVIRVFTVGNWLHCLCSVLVLCTLNQSVQLVEGTVTVCINFLSCDWALRYELNCVIEYSEATFEIQIVTGGC